MNEVTGVSTVSTQQGYEVLNSSGLPDSTVLASDGLREVAAKLATWVDNARTATRRTTMFDRGSYTPPDNPYDEMRAAKIALHQDDIVSGVAEITEAFAFQGVKWEGEEADEADVFNQISRDLDLDSYVRRVWREEYAFGQSVTAMTWGWSEFTVRGRTTKGNKRKKTYRVWCPQSLHVLDSTMVVPVGHGPLGSELLAWASTEANMDYYRSVYAGQTIDPLMLQFFLGSYEPDDEERHELEGMGVDTRNLLLLNPEMVWRHTTTKSDYERFAPVRLKSIFGLLDLKRQLIASDRASLVGAANYILLVRKGEKDRPGTPEEIQNLKDNFNFVAKLPVVISDHRLTIDIIAPSTDFTLQTEKYDVLDTRMLARLLGTLSLGGRGQRNETNVTLSRAVARSMENRRHMLKRSLEKRLARAVVKHPKNQGVFDTEPNLVYTPRNIALDVEAALVQAILGLRTQREISRETILEYFGLDQATEAQRMEMEEEVYDDIFKTAIPFSSPQMNPAGGDGERPVEPPAASGRRGGRPIGGGQSPQNPTSAKPRSANGNPST